MNLWSKVGHTAVVQRICDHLVGPGLLHRKGSRSRSWCSSSSTRFIPKGFWDCKPFFLRGLRCAACHARYPGQAEYYGNGLPLSWPWPRSRALWPCCGNSHRNQIGNFRFPPARGSAVNASHTYPAAMVQEGADLIFVAPCWWTAGIRSPSSRVLGNICKFVTG